ncbi:phage terminase large subunit [Sphingomonas sp. SUN019]|uniref:phage terminase large subunit n=1 Tax=Sphingomonas sp. SUN019 TaxID=2937788 RepID=UPI002164C799|nr:phage terminase large subunit [Sphingomonas sp. SUN019]UVO50174.1 phage terminase large subunit [Sphingomonas sp. SUN019]
MTDTQVVNAVLRADFHAFNTRVFQTLNPSEEFKDNWSIESMTWCLEKVRRGTVKRQIINAPPRGLKSMLTSVALPAFVLGHDPGAKFLCVSHSADLANRFGRECRRVMESDWYRHIFPDTVLSKTAEDAMETTAGGGRKASSLEAGLTGHGGNYIIIDDPLPANEITSPVARQKAIRLYRESLHSRLDDKANGKIVLVMQRLHEDDLTGFLMDQPRFERLILPAVAPRDEDYELWHGRIHHRREGDLLHPEHEPAEVIDETRALYSAHGFAAQMQQDPVPDKGNNLKLAGMPRYTTVPPRGERRVTISWDTAIKGVPEADFSVATVWSEQHDSHYLLHVHRVKKDLPQLVDDAIMLNERFRPDFTLVEAQGSGSNLNAYLRAQHIYPTELRPKGDKETRFSSASYYFEKGQVVFPLDAAWLTDLERELLQFPNARHDDQADSVSQYLNWSRDRGQTGFIYHGLDLVEDPTPETLTDLLLGLRYL